MTDYAAKSLYAQAYKQGQWHRVWSILTRHPHRLLSLAEIEATCTVTERSHAGVRAVPIDRIQGSENRVNDFDRHFYPRQDHNKRRWLNVASARLQGKGLPAVELIQVGDIYFCRDGHHRISVARALEQQDIDAAYEYLRLREEVDPWRVGAIGNSMGGATLILYAASNQNLKAIAVHSAYAQLEDVAVVNFRQRTGIPANRIFITIVRILAERETGCSAKDVAVVERIGEIGPRPVLIM